MVKFTVLTPILFLTIFVSTRQSPIQSGPRALSPSATSSLTVRWDLASDALYFRVYYRQKGVESQWKSKLETYESEVTIFDLLPDTVYEIVLKKRSKVTHSEIEVRKEERRTAPDIEHLLEGISGWSTPSTVVNGDFGPSAKNLEPVDELASFDKCYQDVWNTTILPRMEDLGSSAESSIAKLRRVQAKIIEVKKKIKEIENKQSSLQCQADKFKVSASEVKASELLDELNDERKKWIVDENELITNFDDILERLKLVRQRQLADIAAINTLTLRAAKMTDVNEAEAKRQAEDIREHIKAIRQRVQTRMTHQKN